MKRTVVVLGVAAAMALAPAVASAAGTAPQPTKPVKAKKSGTQGAARPTAVTIGLQITGDERSGNLCYRLGNSGLWME